MAHQSELIENDILAYLKQHENKDMLRFITCGNVDDGKSTLIGRLLHDSKLIFEDQLAAIQRDSQKYNTTDDDIDLALLVDGLQAEREQGITIDVAYRYFSTEKRKFIIADCPGHEQYTRNMATGASTSDLAVILIDARYGVQTQTRRHSYIVSLLGIRHVVVAINKMDLLDYREEVYQRIRQEYLAFADELNLPDIHFVPLSALRGDNVVTASARMPWYEGPSLMQLLESIELQRASGTSAFRFPVQFVNRPHLDFRGFCGTIAAGEIRAGDEIVALPSGKRSWIKRIVTADGDLPCAVTGQAITLTLNDEIDVSRGDMLVRADEASPAVVQDFTAHVVWMNEAPLIVGKEYAFKLAGKQVYGKVRAVNYRVDVNSLQQIEAGQMALNEIALCQISLNAPVVLDPYAVCRGTGSFIVIDRLSNATAGAGMVLQAIIGLAGGMDDERLRWQDFQHELDQLIRQHFPQQDIGQIRRKIGQQAG